MDISLTRMAISGESTYLVFEQAVPHAKDAVDAKGLGEHGAEG